MGFHVYITRAGHPADGPQLPIPQRDWRDLIDRDPELIAPDEALPSYVLWSGPSKRSAPWIDWADGNLFSRSPDDALFGKLFELAECLEAEVRGENGEAYRLEGGTIIREVPVRDDPAPILREEREAARRIAPRLEDILDEVEPMLDDSAPPEAVPSEVLFGPKPQNVETGLELAVEGGELHAEAHFAQSPESALDGDHTPTVPVADLPFGVGARVRTSWGRPATIVSIDLQADDGMGLIEIRYDDGRIAEMSCVAHGLIPL